MKRSLRILILLTTFLGFHDGAAAEIRVAVAANFARCLEALTPAFAAATGHEVVPIVGSTGRLYTQIRQGAPFDVFLAADKRRPQLLVAEELAREPFVYARGRLVLWSSLGGTGSETSLIELLTDPRIRHLALANPELAPYGRAAEQVLEHLGLDPQLGGRRVQGASVAQVWQFAESGHVQAAFLALAQMGDQPADRFLILPEETHEPIDQMAVLLLAARQPEAARQFLAYLAGAEAAPILQRFGYRTVEPEP